MTDGRRVDYLPLSQIRGALRNPKRHADAAIRASIERFGVAELPLLDERTGRLVAGHGRLTQAQAMHAAGEDPPDGVTVNEAGEWCLPVIRGWASRSDAEASAYLVASNQLTIAGGWDEDGLGPLLAELRAIDPDLLAVTHFTDDDVARMLDGPSGGGKAPPDDFPEYDSETIHTDHTCPACGYQFSGGKGGTD